MSSDRKIETSARAWQRMLSGRRLDLLAPSPGDIEISDIAHGLARVARWNGQTTGEHTFSVAQHTLLVENIASVLNPDWDCRWRLATLLHDAPEYVIGDLISPFKAAIGLDYRAFEARLLGAIHLRFGLPEVLPTEITGKIKSADHLAAYFEATKLAGFSPEEAEIYFGSPVAEQLGALTRFHDLSPVSTKQAQTSFLIRFNEVLTMFQDCLAMTARTE